MQRASVHAICSTSCQSGRLEFCYTGSSQRGDLVIRGRGFQLCVRMSIRAWLIWCMAKGRAGRQFVAGTSHPAVAMVVNLTRKEAVSRFSKVRRNYWLITLINVGSWRDACCRVADLLAMPPPPHPVCAILARRAASCEAGGVVWIRGLVVTKRDACIAVTIIIIVLWRWWKQNVYRRISGTL